MEAIFVRVVCRESASNKKNVIGMVFGKQIALFSVIGLWLTSCFVLEVISIVGFTMNYESQYVKCFYKQHVEIRLGTIPLQSKICFDTK